MVVERSEGSNELCNRSRETKSVHGHNDKERRYETEKENEQSRLIAYKRISQLNQCASERPDHWYLYEIKSTLAHFSQTICLYIYVSFNL